MFGEICSINNSYLQLNEFFVENPFLHKLRFTWLICLSLFWFHYYWCVSFDCLEGLIFFLDFSTIFSINYFATSWLASLARQIIEVVGIANCLMRQHLWFILSIFYRCVRVKNFNIKLHRLVVYENTCCKHMLKKIK